MSTSFCVLSLAIWVDNSQHMLRSPANSGPQAGDFVEIFAWSKQRTADEIGFWT